MSKVRIFNRSIALPNDHGSWIFIISPLLIGSFAAEQFDTASIAFILLAMSVFLLRQPSAIMVKAFSGRRPRNDLPIARFWFGFYGLTALFSFLILVGYDHGEIAWLALPGIPVFAWHLWLISRRKERRQMGIELLGTGILALAAPGSYWVGTSSSNYWGLGWWLWVLVWLQNAGSIVFAYARLGQREPLDTQAMGNQKQLERKALIFSSINIILVFILGQINILSRWLTFPYLIQWMEVIWGTRYPATGWRPSRIGIRQLVVSVIWTIIFVITWRFK